MNIYHLAFQHSSIHNSVHMNNERLELLGDAVIDLVIADFLFKKYPYKSEGFLTEMRSKIVSREQLNRVAIKIGLAEMMKIRKGGADLSKSSVLGNALEALVGAIYVDYNYDKANSFFMNKILKPHFDVIDLEGTVVNFKSKIIEWAQKHGKDAKFDMLEEKEHKGKKQYRMGLLIDNALIAENMDYSKKRAEQKAAEMACKLLGIHAE
ncbi:MAG: ribonuclease III [Fimbriimonadaceae bacterium]|nr:ribonuclease III [Chitinophagales bacterium]